MKQSLVALLFFLPTNLHGQPSPAPSPKREGKAEFAFVATTGNASTQSIGAAGEIIYRPAPWIVTAKAAFVRNEAKDLVTAKSFATLARAARTLTPRLEAFGQHGYLRDLFSGIEHRNLLDAGISYLLLQTAPHTLVADGGLGFLNEQRRQGPDLSTGTLTGGLRYKLKISATSELTDEALVGIDLSEAGTWRLNHAAAVTAKMTTIFSLKFSHVVRFVNVPVPGFKQTDTVTAAALVASF